MSRQVVRRLGALIAIALLSTAFWGTAASPAHAVKAIKSMAFGRTSDRIEVLTIYETSAAAQKMVSKSLKVANKPMKKAAGFKGLSVLQSQDGKRVAALSQWEELESYQAFAESLALDSSRSRASDSAFSPPAPAQTLTWEVVEAQAAIAGATPAIRGREPVVQFAQFTAKTPDVRSQVMEILRATIPELFQKQPIPQSILLLRSPDSGDYALLSIWNCSAAFEDVGQPTAIASSEGLSALADSDQHLYDVVTILPAPTKKDKDKDFSYY